MQWGFLDVLQPSGRPFGVGSEGNPLAGIDGARADLIGAGNPVLDPGRSKGAKIQEYFDPSLLAKAGHNR